MCAKCGGGTMALGGTSSATPAAAGMTAQLLNAKPELGGDKDQTVTLYQDTGVDVIGDAGKKRIDLYAAVTGEITPPPPPPRGELLKSETANFTLADGENAEYTITIPANASNLQVSITGGGDLDLYVKDSAISWPGDKGSHNTDTFKAPYGGSSNESVDFPTPTEGTWYVLANAYSSGDATITATWSTGGDGVGDNGDAFPEDPNETVDTDGDGVGDNSDAYPDDPSRWEEETSCYTDEATSTVLTHYTSGRLNVSEYIAMGSEYGYMTVITLYEVDGTWVDSVSCP